MNFTARAISTGWSGCSIRKAVYPRQILPASWCCYGNQPLVYVFSQLALSTLRGYKGYQYPDDAPRYFWMTIRSRTRPCKSSA
jgi:hypothetical protein